MSETTDSLERQAEAHRAHVSDLVDELKDRVQPGEMVDEFLSWETGREMLTGLGRQIGKNPLPCAMIGGGLVWLAVSAGSSGKPRNRKARSHRTSYGTPGTRYSGARYSSTEASNGSQHVTDGIANTITSATSKVGDFAHDAVDKGSDLAATAASGISGAASHVTGAAASVVDSASDMADRVGDAANEAGTTLTNLVREQPLILAGLGLALGAALATLLPVTQTESELMGEASAGLKSQVGGAAQAEYEKLKTTAEHAYDAATEEVKHATKGPPSGSTVGQRARTGDILTGDAPQSGLKRDGQSGTLGT
ncbi:MAG TPA: DUF3618 domain-containing protein [Rhizomicrobium sp.]